MTRPDYHAQPGLVLALHKNREAWDFTVSLRVLGTEFPPVNVEKHIAEVMATGGYKACWFQPLTTWPEGLN